MSRNELNKRGSALRERLGLAPGACECAIGFDALLAESSYGAIWLREGLSLGDRMLCTLAALVSLGRSEELPPMIEAALRIGLEPRAIVEVFAHSGLYGGFGAAESAMRQAQILFEARGIALEMEAPRDDSLETLDARGQQFLSDLHGERSTRGYASPDNPYTGALYALATRFLYGELWVRPGLGQRERLLCALAAFAVMGLETQLRKFCLSARGAGIENTEILEAIIQTAPYGGFPRALNALAVVGEAFESSAA